MFIYKLGRINPPFYIINVIFFENDTKYNLEIDINLIDNYNKYIFISKVNNPYYTAKNKQKNDVNKDIVKGDIIKVNSFNKLNYIKDKVEYKSTIQFEYDKYQYCIGETNSNSKLYKYIYNYMINYFKNDYINKKIASNSKNNKRILVI